MTLQFDTIADRYDRCNHLFSLGIDRYWRKRLARELSPSADHTALDLCCGTGDSTFALLRHSPLRHVIGVDCSEQMIRKAQEKWTRIASQAQLAGKQVQFTVADATSLPFADASFDAVTCVFGLRNIPDRTTALHQMHRVLKPGGRVVICEFSLPTQPLLRAVYGFYLLRIMPFLGRWVLGRAEPLRYLAQTIQTWCKTVHLEDELTQSGFVCPHSIPMTGGIVTLTLAQKP